MEPADAMDNSQIEVVEEVEIATSEDQPEAIVMSDTTSQPERSEVMDETAAQNESAQTAELATQEEVAMQETGSEKTPVISTDEDSASGALATWLTTMARQDTAAEMEPADAMDNSQIEVVEEVEIVASEDQATVVAKKDTSATRITPVEANVLKDKNTRWTEKARWIAPTEKEVVKAIALERFEREADSIERSDLARHVSRHGRSGLLIFPVEIREDHEIQLDGIHDEGTHVLLLCKQAKLSVWMSRGSTKTGKVGQYGASHLTDGRGSLVVVNQSDYPARGWAIVTKMKPKSDR
jgi:hypothetical protein